MELGSVLAALLDTGYEPAHLLQPAGRVVVDAVDSVALIVEGDQGIACMAMSGDGDHRGGTQWGLSAGKEGAAEDGRQRGQFTGGGVRVSVQECSTFMVRETPSTAMSASGGSQGTAS